MNARERFRQTCKFGPVDRPFHWEALGALPETFDRWHQEGMPPDVLAGVPYPGWSAQSVRLSDRYAIARGFASYFEMDRREYLDVEAGFADPPIYPRFPWQLVDEDERTWTYVDGSGITRRQLKGSSSMPAFVKSPVAGWEDWERLKPRLDPATPGRYPDWIQTRRRFGGRDFPLGVQLSGAFGLPRMLLGFEGFAFALYDQPRLVEAIISHWLDLYTGIFETVLANVEVDFVVIWEDMAGNTGPLISPAHFRALMLPNYKLLVRRLHGLGVPVVFVDSDGNVEQLLPLFVEAGVDGLMPFEVQAGMDVVEVRRRYGSAFAMLGGLDKRALPSGPGAIRDELLRKVPYLYRTGGYIAALDHNVLSETPLANFRLYLDLLRGLGDSTRRDITC